MKAIVVGSGGQLGRALCAALPGATALTRAELDLADPGAVARFDVSGADVVLNAAAYTAVDAAESPEGRRAAWAVNAVAPGLLARACARAGVRLVHISSEYVFDGACPGPIAEDAPLAPLSAYGASKAAGDVAVAASAAHAWVVRPTWVIGDGTNFARTMLALARRGVSPTVVADQVGRPTLAADLAAGIVRLLGAEPEPGVYHLTNGGPPASWAEVARTVFAAAGRDPGDVTETTTAAWSADRPQAAPRPRNSVLALDKAAAAGVVLPDWRESLAVYLAAETGAGPGTSGGNGTPREAEASRERG